MSALKDGILLGNRYRVVGKINQGGMQEVWQAMDLALDRHVAVKTPINASAQKRFEQSARMSARVRHPNVAAAFDYLSADEPAGEFYVEELIDGIDLQQCMSSYFTRLDTDTACHILHHLAKGISASHAVQVVHRDLKPSNVMVSKDLSFSFIKITDFGIAKLAQSEIERGIDVVNETGNTAGVNSTMLGAMPFLAPEVLRKGKMGVPPIGPPSDIWSLGAMGYWLLTGQYPFGEGFDAVAGILTSEHRPWDALHRAENGVAPLKRNLQAIIDSCLQRDVASRPTAPILAQQLADCAYLSTKRETASKLSSGPFANVWFARTKNNTGVMIHQSEVIDGIALKAGDVVNYVSAPGHPNPRAVSVLVLKKMP